MQLQVGEIVEGKVTGIKNYGAFVELGDGKSGMVFISEISNTYVNDINDYLKLGDTVKAMVTNIGEDGKISLSIKRTLPKEESPRGRQGGPRSERRPRTAPSKPDGSYIWTPTVREESGSLDDMINRFKASSDEKFSDLKRRNPEIRRQKRGTGVK